MHVALYHITVNNMRKFNTFFLHQPYSDNIANVTMKIPNLYGVLYTGTCMWLTLAPPFSWKWETMLTTCL